MTDQCCDPIEACLAKRPAQRGCGCCELRTGTIAGSAFLCLYLVFEMLGGGILGLLIGFVVHGEYESLVKRILLAPGALVYAFSAWSTFQRNTKQVHIVVRLQLLFAAFLLCCLPFAWLGVNALCVDQEEGLIDFCAQGGYQMLVMHPGVNSGFETIVNATSCASADNCAWSSATMQCLPTYAESMCEHTIDYVEYVGITTVIGLVVYVAWVSHSFALITEKGAGEELGAAEESQELE